jgi:hypothetical protein
VTGLHWCQTSGLSSVTLCKSESASRCDFVVPTFDRRRPVRKASPSLLMNFSFLTDSRVRNRFAGRSCSDGPASSLFSAAPPSWASSSSACSRPMTSAPTTSPVSCLFICKTGGSTWNVHFWIRFTSDQEEICERGKDSECKAGSAFEEAKTSSRPAETVDRRTASGQTLGQKLQSKDSPSKNKVT